MIKFIESFYTITVTICDVAFFVIVIIFIPLLVFRKTRRFSRISLFYFSYLFGLNLWLLSFLLTFKTLGLFWLLIGLLIVGIAIFPLAIIGSGITAQWEMFFMLIIEGAIFAFLRFAGLYINKEI